MIYTIKLFEIVGEKAIEPNKGELVGDIIRENLQKGNNVEVDFSGITSILSMFLNPAIGDLYGAFSEEEIKIFLKVKNVPNEYLEMLSSVVNRAKTYYKDTKRKTANLDEVLSDE